jgi:elongation factor G
LRAARAAQASRRSVRPARRRERARSWIRLEAGEIGAIIGDAAAERRDAQCDPAAADHARGDHAFAGPIVRVAVEAGDLATDREKLGVALRPHGRRRPVAAPRPPTADTGQSLLAGMGQLHLEIAVERLATEHGVTWPAADPRVAYRSSLGVPRDPHLSTRQAEAAAPGSSPSRDDRGRPGAARYAGLVFEDRIRGAARSRGEYRKARRERRARRLPEGLLDRRPLPVVDVAVVLLDGETHANDSSELAFQLAGRAAFREACSEAAPMRARAGDAARGHVRSTATSARWSATSVKRRGQILAGLESSGDARVVRAELPLAESFGYAGAARRR